MFWLVVGRSSGSKSDVTHSLEGFGVTEAGRPRGHRSSQREQRGARLRAHLSLLPPLFNHLAFFLLRDDLRRDATLPPPRRLQFATTCSLPLPASLPEMQRYLAWSSLSLFLPLFVGNVLFLFAFPTVCLYRVSGTNFRRSEFSAIHIQFSGLDTRR